MNNHRQALQLKISQWSPWPAPMSNIILQNGFAQVWCWPAESNGNKQSKHLVESRYRPRPETPTQVQLLACDKGVEAQYWQQGILKESHWWPEQPHHQAWLNFQRAAGLEHPIDLPASLTEKLTQPWGKDYSLKENALLVSSERMLWTGLPLIVVFFLGWQGAQIYQLTQDINEQNRQQDALSQQIEPILKIRGAIQDDQRYLSQVVNLWQQPRQLELLNQIIAKLPDPAGMKIMLWEYQPNQLRFTLQTTNTDPSLFVKTYSELPWGKDVTAQPDSRGNQITISIRLQPHANL